MTLVPDFNGFSEAPARPATAHGSVKGGSPVFWTVKACADIFGALILLPAILILTGLLLVLNPFLNPGPLLFRQQRMGRNGKVFTVLKFRTMAHHSHCRGPLDPLETDRIPRIGRMLRRTGLDELPQAFNILRGEMSLIGPRPDCARHARLFLEVIPEYRQRLSVKPGMSGLAQVTLGYAVGLEATRAKVKADADYIARAGFRQEFWITWRTLLMVLMARGD